MEQHTSTAVDASVPINLHGWMNMNAASAEPTSRRSSYVENAVDVAWMLTKHLCRITALSPETRLENHVVAENVMIYVRPPSPRQNNGALAPLATTDVRLHLLSGVVSPPFDFDAGGDGGASSSSCPVCVALGRMLLEIFSMGKSRSLEIAGGMAMASSNDSININRPADGQPPAAKRQATAGSAGWGSASTSTVAKNLLLSLGMPVSICRLVCDLLNPPNRPRSDSAFASLEDLLDAGNESCPNVAITSLKEALLELTQMKTSPQKFLFDRTCPRKALDDTCLFTNTDRHVIGRERVISALMTAKEHVSAHVRAENENENDNDTSQQMSPPPQGSDFLCQAVFLSGYAGSGKSSVVNSLVQACNEDKWFVLGCKIDKQSAPHMVLARAFDDFFGKFGTTSSSNDDGTASARDPEMMQSFNGVCRRIFATMDEGGLRQLCDLVPNVARAFPLLSLPGDDRGNNQAQDDTGIISSMDKVGSAEKRRRNIFNVLFNSLCSAGRPVLLKLDDLQWSESSVMEDVADFVVNYVHDTSGVSSLPCRRGLLVAGTFRSENVKESDDLMKRIDFMRRRGRADVVTLTVGELSPDDVSELVSEKLCLPRRYASELADLVHGKTRGNPFFVIQFLRSILQRKILTYSVRHRRWTWDMVAVDMQMISEGVAELLVTRFSQLPSSLMQTVKIVSCLGSQVEESTIGALDAQNKILPYGMRKQLTLAVKEGIMEKAGPVYQFTHDIIHQTIYELISKRNRHLLHKTVGENLLKNAENNPTIHLLAVDQINLFCREGEPDPEERARFSRSNAAAAKFAMASTSFEQARSYINTGMQLLESQHWTTQYALSLDLFEMSASLSCMHGDISKMPACLDEILSHARTFDDSLKASSLLVKLLASSSKFEEVRSNCLIILNNLGETFPREISLPVVMNELSYMQTTLRGITRDQIKRLRPMTDRNKLNAMKFLNMLCMYSVISKVMLLPLLCCRMVRLTMAYGFCDDSIVGLATVGLAVFHYTDDIQLAQHICKVSESLVEESPKRHLLRSRLCKELTSVLNVIVEPSISSLPIFPELYNSAMLSGDVENAMICRWWYCAVYFWIGACSIFSASKKMVLCNQEAAKYQQNTIVLFTMSTLNVCSFLSGRACTEIHVPSYEELNKIGEQTRNGTLIWQNCINQMSIHFWMREYKDIAELTAKHSEKDPSAQEKRILKIFRSFYEGVAYLNLARDTKQYKWKNQGKKTAKWMTQLESVSKWNFGNKAKLLRAELQYTEGDLESAEASYLASIESARDHKLIHEEAMACELYGIFCVENRMVGKGSTQLRAALGKYEQWGATKKAAELRHFIDLVDLSYLRKLKRM